MTFHPAREPHESLTACPVCLSPAPMSEPTYDRYGFEQHLCFCGTCRLRYLNPRMTAAAYGRFYQHTYRPLLDVLRHRPLAPGELAKAQVRYATTLANWCGDLITGPVRRLLDIGGGTGVVADYFKTRFAVSEATVLDPSREELEDARARGLHTLEGLIEDLPTIPPADLYLMCQTIDHLLHPRVVFERLHAAMPPGSWLLVDILVFNLGVPLNLFIKVDHPLYFTGTAARHLLTATGFTLRAEGESPDRRKRFFLCQP